MNVVAVALRAIAYSTLFVGILLVYLPAQALARAGVTRPSAFEFPQMAGAAVTFIGGAIALWCIATFVVVGRGTPAPFDPPRRLVVGGPYRCVRNPMYLGAALALSGAALYYQSASLLVYAGAFLIVMHVLVVAYEESILRRTFGPDYEAYCRQVRRWLPGRRMALD